MKSFDRELNISGVTLHSYRYAWAERAKSLGYPERFAQGTLGHARKAIHGSYARNAEVRVPSLEAWEQQLQNKVVKMTFKTEPVRTTAESVS